MSPERCTHCIGGLAWRDGEIRLSAGARGLQRVVPRLAAGQVRRRDGGERQPRRPAGSRDEADRLLRLEQVYVAAVCVTLWIADSQSRRQVQGSQGWWQLHGSTEEKSRRPRPRALPRCRRRPSLRTRAVANYHGKANVLHPPVPKRVAAGYRAAHYRFCMIPAK